MLATVYIRDLRQAIDVLAKATLRDGLPVLGAIRIRSEVGRLVLDATDLEISATATLPTVPDSAWNSGEYFIPVALLLAAVKEAGKGSGRWDKAEILGDPEGITISAQQAAGANGLWEADTTGYPTAFLHPDGEVVSNDPTLAEVWERQVMPGISPPEFQKSPVLQYVGVTAKANLLVAQTTDTYRLHESSRPTPGVLGSTVLLRPELIRLAAEAVERTKAHKGGLRIGTSTATWTIDGRTLAGFSDNAGQRGVLFELTGTLGEGAWPELERQFPQSPEGTIIRVLQPKLVRESLTRVTKAFANGAKFLKLTFGTGPDAGRVWLAFKLDERTDTTITLGNEVEIEGARDPADGIGLSPDFLIAALAGVKDYEPIELVIRDRVKPVLFRAGSYRGLILPIRLS